MKIEDALTRFGCKVLTFSTDPLEVIHLCGEQYKELEEYFDERARARNAGDGSHVQSTAAGEECGATDASDSAESSG